MKICLLAKGESLNKYPGSDGYDEVWGLNQVAMSHDLSRVFVMDDLRGRLPLWTGPEFPLWLQTYDKPIITSTAYPEWPTSQPFPIEDIARWYELPLGISMYSTVDYMLALAIYECCDRYGFDGNHNQIDLFGIDCADPKREETVRVSIGKWIGAAQSRNIIVTSQPGSFFQYLTVTGICYEKGLYGYIFPPRIEDLACKD